MRWYHRIIVALAVLLLTACGPEVMPSTLEPSQAPPESTLTTMEPTDAPIPTLETTQSSDLSQPTDVPPTVEATPTPLPSWCEDLPDAAPIPTGKLRMAYVSGSTLYVADEGQPPIAAYPVEDLDTLVNHYRGIELSDDGALVAYPIALPNRAVEIWVANADGSGTRRVVSENDFRDRLGAHWLATEEDVIIPESIGWVPHTHTLFINTVKNCGGECSGFGGEDLWLIDVDTMQFTQLLQPGEVASYSFTFSPDGTQVAYQTWERINLINIDGSNRREDVLPSCGATDQGCDYYLPLIWASDSQSLIAIQGVPTEGINDVKNALMHIPVDGGAPEKIGEVPAHSYDMLLSPDRSYVLYSKHIYEPSYWMELHLARVDGSEDILLATAYGTSPLAWSPDSRHFVYEMLDGDHITQIGSLCGEQVTINTPIELPEDFRQSTYPVTWLDASRFLMERVEWKQNVEENYLVDMGWLDGSVLRLLEIDSFQLFDSVVLPDN